MFKYSYLYFFVTELISFIFFGMVSCTSEQENQNKQPEISKEKLQESLEKVNRKLVLEEAAAIDAYANRHGLETTKTGSGLQFVVTKKRFW